MVAKNTSRYEPSQSSRAWPSPAMAARSSGVTVTPSRASIAETGSAASGGRVRLTSMSVVALGLRYQARAMAPPNWCGTPARLEHLVERDDLGDQVAELAGPGQRLTLASARRPCATRRPQSGPAAGTAAAPGRRGAGRLTTWADETEEVDEGVAGISRRRRRGPGGSGSKRSSHPARRLDELPRPAGRSWRVDRTGSGCWCGSGPVRRRHVRHRRRRAASPAAGPRASTSVGRGARSWPGSGPGTLRRVDRLPDLEAALGAGDHVTPYPLVYPLA